MADAAQSCDAVVMGLDALSLSIPQLI
jgi:hypothetical protein